MSEVKKHIRTNNLSNVRVIHYDRKISPKKQALFIRYGFRRLAGMIGLQKQLNGIQECDTTNIHDVDLSDKEALERVLVEYNRVFTEYKKSDWIDNLLVNKSMRICEYKINQKTEGYLIFYINEDNDKKFGFIEILMINENSRKKGIGKNLLAYAHNSFYEQGVTTSKLEVWAPNYNAHKFFTRQGYELERSIGITLETFM